MGGKDNNMNTLKEEMIKRVEELNEKLEEKEFHLEVKEAFKNNGNKFGITILSDNDKCKMCPVFYKDSLEDILYDDDKVIEFLEKIYEENKDKKLDVKKLCSRDYILENVRLRVVSDANMSEIKKMDIAYKHYLDMLILFYIDVSEASTADATASVTLRKEELVRAGIEQTELLESAIRNIENDYVVSSMEKVICEILGIPVEEAPDMSGDIEMYVITNSHKMFGAASLLSTRILNAVSYLIGGDFVILPSSIHEFIAVPYGNMESEELREMVREVNDREVLPEDRLTYSVYKYSKGELSIM